MKHLLPGTLMCCLLLCSFSSFSQKNSPLFDAYHSKARQFIQTHSDSAFHYCDLARKQVKSHASKASIQLLITEAEVNQYANNYVRGIALAEQAIALAVSGKYNRLTIDGLTIKGAIHSKAGDVDQSIESFQKALNIAEEHGFVKSKAWLLNNLAEMHRYFDEAEKSIAYQKEALSIYRELRDTSSIASILQNLSNAYGNTKIGQFEQAISYMDTVLMLPYANFLSRSDSARVYNNIGRLYSMSGNIKLAEVYLLKALEMKKGMNELTGNAFTINELLTLYTRSGQYEKASLYVDDAMYLKDTVKQAYLRRNMHDRLYEYYYDTGKYQLAAAMADSARWIVTDIFNIEKQSTVSKMEVQFRNKEEILAKEREIFLLEQNKKIVSFQRNLAILAAILIGGLIFWFYRNRAINKQKEAERLEKRTRELEELDNLKSRFFANISHELRTPLTLIIGPVEQLLKSENKDWPVEKLKTIRKHAGKLKLLVDEILDLSKLDSRKLEVKSQTTQFKSFIDRLFASFKSLADIQHQQYQLSYFLPESLNVEIDQKKFEQIFNNLVSNALKYTPVGGSIVMNVDQTHSGSHLQIKIKDSGRGIHPEDLPYVFDRYFQSNQKDAPIEGGTGIGLALAKELSELMGGNLKVESEWEKGSTFILTLPLLKSKKDHLPVASSTSVETLLVPVQGPSNTDKPTILLVEDNVDLQHFIKDVLSPYYQVEQALNGKEALKMLESGHAIELIVTDVMMPEMDGFSMLEKIRSEERYLGLPVVMLTARAEVSDKMKALVIGVDDYLTKPFVSEELLVRIQNLMTRKQERTNFEVSHDEADTDPKVEPIHKVDLKWLKEVESIVNREMKNAQFNLLQLSGELQLSERQVQRRIKKITGLSSNKYIRELKLHRARQLVETGQYQTISELSYAVGFDTPHYFSRIYLERFGVRPGDST